MIIIRNKPIGRSIIMWFLLFIIYLNIKIIRSQINKQDNDFIIQQQQQIQQLLYTKDYDFNQDHKRIIKNYHLMQSGSSSNQPTGSGPTLNINRIFKVHIEEECKEFKTSDKCKDKSCIVYELEDNEVPQQIKQNLMLFNVTTSHDKLNLDDSTQNGYYYNFEMVPDGNTDYHGQKVWKHLHSIASEHQVMADMISGMHTSVSSHITYNYRQVESYIYEHNIPAYKNKMSYYNQQQYAEWNRNLYKLENLVGAALKTISSSSHQSLYPLDTLKALQLEDFKHKAANDQKQKNKNNSVSNIWALQSQMYNTLNCVECLKCKINSKIQMLGIITAFQLVNGEVKPEQITHNQFVAIMETYYKTVKSIWIFDKMVLFIQEDNFYNQLKMFYMKIAGLLIAFLTFGYYFCKNQYMNRQLKMNLNIDNEKEALI